MRTLQRKADVSLNAWKDIGLTVNKGEKYMVVHHRGVMANKHITVRSNFYEIVITFQYLGSSSTNQNSLH
jgi:hypothetical protein